MLRASLLSNVECRARSFARPEEGPKQPEFRGFRLPSVFRRSDGREEAAIKCSAVSWLLGRKMPHALVERFAPGATVAPSPVRRRLDVLGLGEAMIDFSAFVDDEGLATFGVEKGGRRVIGLEERLEAVHRLGESYVVRAGGSIANSLTALAQLSRAGEKALRLGFAGSVGSDRLGDFYSAHLERHGIELLNSAEEGGETLTGCVIVLTTPDAQRSFLVYPGDGKLRLTDEVKESIASSRMMVIEGYLFGLPGLSEDIKEAVEVAHQSGTAVVVTGGAAEVVERAYEDLWTVIKMGVDIFMCNHSEAAALLGERAEDCCAHAAIQRLARHFPVVAVTDGSNGSYISSMGKLQTVPPYWMEDPPVDTCGAGDVYSAGFLYGFLEGYGLYDLGLAAARSASAILSKHGAELEMQDAQEIISEISKNRTSANEETLALELEEA